jgi:cytidylate kinase
MQGIQATQLSESLVRAHQHWEQRHVAKDRDSSTDPSAAPPMTIAISRQAGARGTSVARQVGAQLGWPVYDHELLERISQEMHVRVELLESIDERKVNWLEERVEAFAAVPHVNQVSYFRHLVETVLSLGLHGQCLIVGRGASFLLPASTTLRVRLVAELADRTTIMAAELGVSRDEAARRIRDADQARSSFVKEHFHLDLAEPLHYDLVLNTSRLTVDDCAAMVITALGALQRRHAEMALQHASATAETDPTVASASAYISSAIASP